jgi:hypothetical protein
MSVALLSSSVVSKPETDARKRGHAAEKSYRTSFPAGLQIPAQQSTKNRTGE